MKKGSVYHRQHDGFRRGRARTRRTGRRRGGFASLDAPVSGGQAGAENGLLTVMVGGDQKTFDRAKPVIDAYARMVGLMGPSGAGQLTKMINQICHRRAGAGAGGGAAFRPARPGSMSRRWSR